LLPSSTTDIESAGFVRSQISKATPEHIHTATVNVYYPHVESGTAPSEERSLSRAFEVAVKFAVTYIFLGALTGSHLRGFLLP
jgi:hypothetical protein